MDTHTHTRARLFFFLFFLYIMLYTPSQETLRKRFFIPTPNEKPPTGVDLYARFAFAGAVCCAITHGAMTPVDVVKTRIQLEPERYNQVRKEPKSQDLTI